MYNPNRKLFVSTYTLPEPTVPPVSRSDAFLYCGCGGSSSGGWVPVIEEFYFVRELVLQGRFTTVDRE